MATIGRTLATIRVQAGLTVSELSARTCIREHVLADIEADDFSTCGGDFYARGHLRALSRELGVDSRPLIEWFDHEHAAEAAPSTPEELFVGRSSNGVERPERRRWPLVVAVAITGAGILAAVHAWPSSEQDERAATRSMAQNVTGSKADERRRPEGETDAASAPGTAAEARAGVREKADEERAREEERADSESGEEVVSLRLSADQRSWVSVADADGGDLYTGFLAPGASKDVSGEKELQLSLGNAGAVRLEVNGKDYGTVDGEGGVAQITVRPDGPVS